MKKNRTFSDFFYNHSDVFLAFIVLIIAAFLILWRIGIIMDYPKTINLTSQETTTSKAVTFDDEKDESKTGAESSGATKATWTGNKLADDFTIKIKGENTQVRIQKLIDAGLFTSNVDFNDTCASQSKKVDNIANGDFLLTKGMTKEDIVNKIIK